MKRIEAVVRRERLSAVKLALQSVPHRGLTACDTTQHDPASGITLHYRATSRVMDMAPRASISVLLDDADVSAAVDAIVAAASTGHETDGTITVQPVEEIVQISAAAAAVA